MAGRGAAHEAAEEFWGAAGLAGYRSRCWCEFKGPCLGFHASEFRGFAGIGSAWRPAWFGLMRIFPPFPPHRACTKFVVLSSWFLVIVA